MVFFCVLSLQLRAYDEFQTGLGQTCVRIEQQALASFLVATNRAS